MYTDWALDCRLSNCEYKTQPSQRKVCEQLQEHSVRLQQLHLDSLPLRFQFPLKSFPVRNQTECADHTDLCMIYCLADLIQFFHQLKESISVESIVDPTTSDSVSVAGFTVVEVCHLLSKYGCTTESGYQRLKTLTVSDKEQMMLLDNNILAADSTMKIPHFTLHEEFGLIHTVVAVKLALVYAGPCLLILPCHRKYGKFWLPFDSTIQKSTTAPAPDKAPAKAKSVALHSILLWGYQPNGFILRNSWSNLWANQGYGVISFEEFMQYKVECWYFLSARALLNMQQIHTSKLR